MERLTMQATVLDKDTRIDSFLAHRCHTDARLSLSRTALSRLIEEGQVQIAGKQVGKSYKLQGHETITVVLPDPQPAAAQAQEIPLSILFEDDDLLVIHKPRGLVVHPAAGHQDGTLVNALLFHCGAQLSGIGGVARPGIVHRLDKDTSGLLLVAKNDFAHLSLSEALQKRDIHRYYKAILRGCPKQAQGIIDAPIGRHPHKRTSMAIVPQGRPARTQYQVLDVRQGMSLVTCKLDTGRTHQIRVHMASIGHPVMGDTLYGAPPVKGVEGQLLHAYRLQFQHPRTADMLDFEAPPPAIFDMVFGK